MAVSARLLHVAVGAATVRHTPPAARSQTPAEQDLLMTKRLARHTSRLTTMLTRSQDGATAVEYAIIASLIAAVIVGTVRLIMPELLPAISDVAASL